MNLPSDLASIHEQVEVAMSHHTDGVLSPDMLSQLVTSMQAFAETYKQGAAQACPLTGQPTTRMTQVEGVTMGTETAMAYMAGQEQFVQLVEQAKQAAPANTVPASFSAEPVEEMGHLSPESQGLEPGAAAPPPPPTPTVPAPTPTVEGFLQNKVAVPPITPAPQATAATAPPATTPPPPVAAPQAGEAAAEQRDMASLIVEEVEARMQGDHGQPIPTDDGTVFYDSMANLVQQYTQWPDEQGRAFLANLATVRSTSSSGLKTPSGCSAKPPSWASTLSRRWRRASYRTRWSSASART